MTGNVLQDPTRVLTVPADFHVSWAGPCPSWIAADACLGSEDGRLFFSPDDSRLRPEDHRFLDSGEAVNGVAFLGKDRIAVSSRGELAFFMRQGDDVSKACVPTGAHGIIAAASGYFVAPLGTSGIMMHKPGGQAMQPWTVHGFDPPVNLYKVTSLWQNGRETFVFAARTDGIVAVEALSDPTAKLGSHHGWESSDKSDIVDVCSLAPNSRAVAGLSWNNELLLIRDVLSETEHPAPFQFSGIRGTAYRILNVQGHIIVLTSRSLYVFEGLGRRFLEGHPVHRDPTRVTSFPMEAVDINPCGEARLLVVLPEAVNLIDLELLLRGLNGTKPCNGDTQHEADFDTALVPIATNDKLTQRSIPQNQEPLRMSV